MNSTFKAFATVALVAPLAAGCATKGWVQARMDTNYKLNIAHTDSSVATEASARKAGDEAVRTDLRAEMASLRKDLDSLRTEFNVKITALANGMQFAMPVNFAFNDATVRPEDQAALARFAQVVNKYYNGSNVTVEGFADPAGTQRYNLRLSQQRADNVKQYLVGQGMTDATLKTIGYGKTRLVVPGAQRDEAGAEKNRRVVFVIETKSDSTQKPVATQQP